MRHERRSLLCVIVLVSLALPTTAFSWSPLTHIFIAQRAGVPVPQYATFPDLMRNENYALFAPFHWHNAAPSTKVTPDYIDHFQITVGDYVKLGEEHKRPIRIRVPDPAGVLYWKILTLYQEMKDKKGFEYDYYLLNIAHYVGDLSQPLHNYPHGDLPASDGKVYEHIGMWSKKNHRDFDYILDTYLPLDKTSERLFQSWIAPLRIDSIEDLKREIANIANESIALANRCYREQRMLTKEEALRQIAKSVSLLKAIIRSTKSSSRGERK